MPARRALIISNHPIFAEGLVRILKQDAGIEIVDCVANLECARSLLQAQPPDTIIVDFEADVPDAQVTNQLIDDQAERRVIFLSLNNSRLILYQRQQVIDATTSDLLALLGTRLDSTISGERKA